MDSYDNDFLFIDDDLFLLLIPVECINNNPMYTMIFIKDSNDEMDSV